MILDVSSYQGSINWDSVVTTPGFQGAIVRLSQWRLSEGGNAKDSRADDNVRALMDKRVPVGGYVRANPWANSPDTECLLMLKRLEEVGMHPAAPVYSDSMIPAIDLEPTDNAILDATVDWPAWIRAFFVSWEHRTNGARLLYYSSGSNFDGRYGGVLDVPPFVSLWVADASAFNHAPDAGGKTRYTFSGRTLLHQHSARGVVPGITGPVDLNAVMPYSDLNRLMQSPVF